MVADLGGCLTDGGSLSRVHGLLVLVHSGLPSVSMIRIDHTSDPTVPKAPMLFGLFKPPSWSPSLVVLVGCGRLELGMLLDLY
jgi:hypothetical protein